MANEKFLETFRSVIVTIPFNPAWKNGTGYLGNAVQGEHMPQFPTGMTVKSIDENGRKIIITSIIGGKDDGDMNGRQVSCVLFFERYSSDNGPHVIVSNATEDMKQKYTFLSGGEVSEEQFSQFHFR